MINAPQRACRNRLVLLLIHSSPALAAAQCWARAPVPVSGAADATASTKQQVPPPPVTAGGPDLPSMIVVPHNYSHDEKLGNGCWVRIFDGESYRGRSLTLVGPVEMPKMNIPGGLWINWGSAVVGPNARVTAFDYEQFQNRSAALRPGQRIPDLRDRKLGLFEDIHSVRISCKS